MAKLFEGTLDQINNKKSRCGGRENLGTKTLDSLSTGVCSGQMGRWAEQRTEAFCLFLSEAVNYVFYILIFLRLCCSKAWVSKTKITTEKRHNDWSHSLSFINVIIFTHSHFFTFDVFIYEVTFHFTGSVFFLKLSHIYQDISDKIWCSLFQIQRKHEKEWLWKWFLIQYYRLLYFSASQYDIVFFLYKQICHLFPGGFWIWCTFWKHFLLI